MSDARSKIPVLPKPASTLPVNLSDQRVPLRPPLRSPRAPAQGDQNSPGAGLSRQGLAAEAAVDQRSDTATPDPTLPAPPSGRSRKRNPLPIPEGLRQIVESAAQQVREKHGMLHREIGERLARRFRTLVTKREKTGRRMTRTVAVALDLRQKKWPWSRIYPVAIPGFSYMEFYEKSYRTYKLRDAVRAHTRRRKKRTSRS